MAQAVESDFQELKNKYEKLIEDHEELKVGMKKLIHFARFTQKCT